MGERSPAPADVVDWIARGEAARLIGVDPRVRSRHETTTQDMAVVEGIYGASGGIS